MDIILYNPLSRNGKSNDVVLRLKETLEKEQSSYSVHSIFEIQDINQFLNELDDEDRVIIVGGDGTLHHLANSIYDYDIKQGIYVLKAGTGNDFIRSLNTKEHLVKINQYIFDLPSATFNQKKHVFLNCAGMGVDARVCHVVNNSKKKKNAFNYFRNAISSFVSHKPKPIEVEIDGKQLSFKKCWLAVVLNSKYAGGGMRFSPKSKREDDLVELMVIERIPRFLLFIIFPTIYLGWHVIFKRYVKMYQGKEIKLSFKEDEYLQMDGESFYPVREITIKRKH